jgi:hypothetical protein
MPPVAASERGGAETRAAQGACRRCRPGVGRSGRRGRQPPRAGGIGSRTPLERAAAAGESPVGDAGAGRVAPMREYRPTRGIGREAGRPTAQG